MFKSTLVFLVLINIVFSINTTFASSGLCIVKYKAGERTFNFGSGCVTSVQFIEASNLLEIQKLNNTSKSYFNFNTGEEVLNYVAPTSPVVTPPTPTPVVTPPTPDPVVTPPTPTPILIPPTPTPILVPPTPTPVVTPPTPDPAVTPPTPSVQACVYNDNGCVDYFPQYESAQLEKRAFLRLSSGVINVTQQNSYTNNSWSTNTIYNSAPNGQYLMSDTCGSSGKTTDASRTFTRTSIDGVYALYGGGVTRFINSADNSVIPFCK